MKVLCRMTSDLRACPITDFRYIVDKRGWCRLRAKGHYLAEYYIRMLVSTADIRFEMWFNGRIRSDLLKISWETIESQVAQAPPQ